MTRSVHLLESTLRDGSYELDFQFRPEDTALIVGALDRAGVRYIEIAHGAGVGTAGWPARTRLPVRSTTSDEEHLAAAQAAATRAEIGILYCVGDEYTPRSWLKTALQYGVKFIRYAFAPPWLEVADNWAYLEDAKAAGLTVSLNLMKTYTVPVPQVARWAQKAAKHGCDWFYVVDSAGGMSPASVREYTRAILDATGMRVGLHAHNNSALALANSLAAVEAGATLVDATLQGIGRATGNASTEQLLLALQRLGHELDVDRDPIFRLGDLARGLFAERGNDPTFFASGAGQLHSRVVGDFKKIARSRSVSDRELLIEVGKLAVERDLLALEAFPADVMDEAVNRITARASSKAASTNVPAPVVDAYTAAVTRASSTALVDVCDELFVNTRKRRKTSVLHLVDAGEAPFPGPLAWESDGVFGMTVPVSGPAPAIADDRAPDVVVADGALAEAWLPRAGQRLRAPLSRLYAEAAGDLLEEWVERRGATVWLPAGQGATLAAVDAALAGRGLRPVAERPSGPAVLVASTQGGAPELALSLDKGDAVVFVGAMSAPARNVVDRLRERGVTALRPALGPVVATLVSRRVAMRARCDAPLQPTSLGGALAVDAALAPATGEIVVDSTAHPTAIADGATPATARAVGGTRAALLYSGRGRL